MCVQCTCIYKCGRVCVHMSMKVRVRMFSSFTPYLVFWDLSLNPAFTYWFDWMASHLWGLICPYYPVWMSLIHVTTTSCFTWVLGMQTQVLMSTQQALYLLSHLPSPKMILIASFLNWLKSTLKVFDHFSPIFLSYPKKFWLLIKTTF